MEIPMASTVAYGTFPSGVFCPDDKVSICRILTDPAPPAVRKAAV